MPPSPPPARARARFALPSSPRAQSVLCMAVSIASHFAGYELARSASLAAFTSRTSGFGSSESMLPTAVGCVAPLSAGLLWLYARILDVRGPRIALRVTTLMFAAAMILGGIGLARLAGEDDDDDAGGFGGSPASSRALIFCLFVYQSGSVQLLCTQHWSFVGSVLSSEEGSVWFAPIAGLGSASSTVAAAAISRLVPRVGLTGLMHLAGALAILSAAFADGAYAIAEQHGFAPTGENKGAGGRPDGPSGTVNLFRRAYDLFRRVPVLGALLVEVLLSQSLSSTLNYLFLAEVRDSISDDARRAGYTGRCYAYVNGISGVLQFFVMPAIMSRFDPGWIWAFMPAVMTGLTAMVAWRENPSLELVGAPFLAMKTMEYSLRSFSVEMLYVSLDYESRYVGKEAIGLLGNRAGKSAAAAALSAAAARWTGRPERLRRRLSAASCAAALMWLACSLRLGALVPGRRVKTE